MAHGDFKNYLEEQLLTKYCVIKHLILLKIRNMMDINVGLVQWSIKFLIKKTSSTRAPSDILRSETLAITEFAGSGIKNENVSNKELAEELHKPVIRKF